MHLAALCFRLINIRCHLPAHLVQTTGNAKNWLVKHSLPEAMAWLAGGTAIGTPELVDVDVIDSVAGRVSGLYIIISQSFRRPLLYEILFGTVTPTLTPLLYMWYVAINHYISHLSSQM